MDPIVIQEVDYMRVAEDITARINAEGLRDRNDWTPAEIAVGVRAVLDEMTDDLISNFWYLVWGSNAFGDASRVFNKAIDAGAASIAQVE